MSPAGIVVIIMSVDRLRYYMYGVIGPALYQVRNINTEITIAAPALCY